MHRFFQLLALLLALSSAGVLNAGTDAGCAEESGDCADCPEQCQCACCPLPSGVASQPVTLTDQAPAVGLAPRGRKALVLAAMTADIFHPPRA